MNKLANRLMRLSTHKQIDYFNNVGIQNKQKQYINLQYIAMKMLKTTHQRFYQTCKENQRYPTYRERSIQTQNKRQKPLRTKTQFAYSSVNSSKNQEDIYADLAVESVKKNYHVSNLKPYAYNNDLLKDLKQQVSSLQQRIITPKISDIYDHKQTFQVKLSKLLLSALKDKQAKEKNTPSLLRKKVKQNFIQSAYQDQHQVFISDYQEQVKQQKMQRQNTIQQINNHIITKYSYFLQNYENKNKKNRILKFKKQRDVSEIYTNDQDFQPKNIIKNYNKILDLKTQDYGIYSRSAKKAIYLKNEEKKDKNQESSSRNSSYTNIKLEKKYYQSYMGSYSQRKRILKNSFVGK